jgi:hypothetical protein
MIISNNKTAAKFVLILLRYFLEYLKYSVLTGLVIYFFATYLTISVLIDPNVSFEWLQYLTIIDPRFGMDNVTLGNGDVMKVFSVISLIVMTVFKLVKFAFKKLFKIDIVLEIKFKIIVIFIAITIPYIIGYIVIIFSANLEKTLLLFLFFLYFGHLFGAIWYFLYDFLANKIGQLTNQLKKH